MHSDSDDVNGDDDKIACRTPRGTIVLVSRKDLLFRPGAYGVIERDGKVLAMRSKHRKYFLPGGGQDKGESLKDCLVREVREETGLPLRVGHYLGVFEDFAYWQKTKQGLHILAHAYAAYAPQDADIRPGIGSDEEGYPEWVDMHYLRSHPEKLQVPIIADILHAFLYGSG